MGILKKKRNQAFLSAPLFKRQRALRAVLFGAIFFLFFVPAHFLNKDITSFDDLSYLSHSFTIGLDGDLDYRNEIATRFSQYGTLPAHPIGSGLLAAPFVAVFGLLDRLTGHEVVENRANYFGSWAYFGFLFAVNFFFLFGIVLYFQTMQMISPGYSTGFHMLIVLSTGVIYYVLGRFTMAHGFEFFALSATVFSAMQVYRASTENRRLGTLVSLVSVGFFVVLNLWIRPSNLNCLVLPFIVLITVSVVRAEPIRSQVLVTVVLSILFWMIPYCLFNLDHYHQLFPSYSVAYNLELPLGETAEYEEQLGAVGMLVHLIALTFALTPNVFLLLFSSEVGVIYSNPILVIGLLGFTWFCFRYGIVAGWRICSILVILVLSYYLFSVAIVLVWKTTASDYGYRYLFPLIPVALLFTVVMLEGLGAERAKRKAMIKSLIVAMSLIGAINVFFYKSTPLLSPQEQENVYGEWHSSSLNGYQINLTKELLKYQTYVLAGGKSYLGLLAAPWLLDTGMADIVPTSVKEKYFPRFRALPLVIYLQTFVLALLWVGVGWRWNRK